MLAKVTWATVSVPAPAEPATKVPVALIGPSGASGAVATAG